MTVSASICMPSMTARKSSCAQAEALHRGDQHARHRSVGLAAVQAGDPVAPGREPRQLVGEGARPRRRCRRRCGRTRRSHTSRDDDPAAARACRGRTRCRPRERSPRPRRDRCAALSGVIGAASPGPLMAGEYRSPAHATGRVSASADARIALPVALQLHPPRQRIAAPQPSRQPMRQADNDRRLQPQPRLRVRRGRSDRRRVQPVDAIEQHDRTRAAAPASRRRPRRSSTDAPQRSSRSSGR